MKAAPRLRFGELALAGFSRAGEESWFRVDPPGLAFEAGRGPLALVGARDLFLTHGHLDHSLGIPYLLSQRTLHGLGATRVVCPRGLAGPVREWVDAAARLEGAEYAWNLLAVEPGDRVQVARDLEVEAFAVDHLGPAVGYHLVRRRHCLAEAYRGLTPPQVAEAKRGGEPVVETREELWLSYTGDTGARVFELEPRLFSTRILLIECTFLAADLRPSAERFKHLHLEDLAEREASFANEAIVLCHLSRRHRGADLERGVTARLPLLAERVHLLLGDEA